MPSVNAIFDFPFLTETVPYAQEMLRSASVPIVSNNDCLDAYQDSRFITDDKICAGDIINGGVDACLVG